MLQRWTHTVLSIAISLCATHCYRSAFLDLGEAADNPPEITSWGDYAASLGVAPCEGERVWIVDTVDSELDGGTTLTSRDDAGAKLSFQEALWLASNNAGRDVVTFSEEIFPSHRPQAITLADGVPVPAVLDEICLDGRSRGVELYWENFVCDDCKWHLGTDSLQIGLTLRPPLASLTQPHFQEIRATSQIAGCNFLTTSAALVGLGGTIGPGNLFVEPAMIRLNSGPLTTIIGNYFNYNPVTREFSADQLGFLVVATPTTFVENVFSSTRPVDVLVGPTVFVHNFFGVNPRDGRALTPADTGIKLFGDGTTFGPGNVVRGGLGIFGRKGNGPYAIKVTQNSITGTANGIVADDIDDAQVLEPQPPVITAAQASGISGTCVDGGTVEVFADQGAQGEIYLGSTTCTASGPWTLAVEPPTDYFVTATVTTAAGGTSAFSLASAVQ